MSTYHRIFVFLLLPCLSMAYNPIAQADMQQSYGYQTGDYSSIPYDDAQQPQTYGAKIGRKVGSGFANLGLGILEIPKNIINVTNESNVIYGLVGGTFKGLVNTAGRMGVGIADLITFPLPTRPIAHPVFIWDDFDVDTTYGNTFRLDKTQKAVPPVVEAPVVQPVVRPVPKPPVVDRSQQYNETSSKKLDTLFKKEMRK